MYLLRWSSLQYWMFNWKCHIDIWNIFWNGHKNWSLPSRSKFFFVEIFDSDIWCWKLWKNFLSFYPNTQIFLLIKTIPNPTLWIWLLRSPWGSLWSVIESSKYHHYYHVIITIMSLSPRSRWGCSWWCRWWGWGSGWWRRTRWSESSGGNPPLGCCGITLWYSWITWILMSKWWNYKL